MIKKRTVLLACQTIRDELSLAICETGVDYPVVYIESGLHNIPDMLHRTIQAEIDKLDNVDVILLAFGYCGHSILGIKSSQARIILPRVDDCIPFLVGSAAARKRISQEKGTYFLTKGWLDHEKNLLWEYERCVGRYGEARALRIMKTMLANYQRIMMIDTGAYPLGNIQAKTIDFAQKLELEHEVAAGSLRLLHKLLIGPWDEEFLIVEPNREIAFQDICSNETVSSQSFAGRER